MTLCIAWKERNELYFAGDSRLSLGGAPPVDACAKIVRLPINVRILGTENDRLEFAIGLAFAGSFITAYTVREILLELLPLAQVVPERVKISLPLFVNIIKKVFEEVTRQVCGSMFDAGMADLLVGGYCPDFDTVRLFNIRPSKVSGSLVFTADELSLSEPAFIGSGAAVARAHANNRPLYELPSVLRTMIHDETVPEVGGPIQFGRTEGRDFKIFGVQDYEVSNGIVTKHYLYRGVRIRSLLEDLGVPYAHFATSYLAPFLGEIDDLASEGKLVRSEE